MDKVLEKKKWPPKRIAKLAGIAVVVLLILYAFVFSDNKSRLNVVSERLTISEVSRGPFQVYIPVSGEVLPVTTVYLDAVEGGRVEAIYCESGAMVKAGDPILKLTNTNLLLDVMNREAQLFEQENNLRNTRLAMEQNGLSLRAELVELDHDIQTARRQHDRDKQLAEKKLISQDQYQESLEQYDYLLKRRELTIESQRQDSLFRVLHIESLEASVKRIEANLGMVKDNLENLLIRAPVSGQLTSLNAEIGELKSAGQRLGRINILEGFKVRAAIDEHYIARVSQGLGGECTLSEKTYRLRLSKNYPEVRDGRFEVDLEFVDEVPANIRYGQTVHIRLELGDLTEATLLPRGGFYSTTGGQWVYVVDESGEYAIKRKIQLGSMNPHQFEVLDGLQAGEKVITSSYENFGDVDKLVLK